MTLALVALIVGSVGWLTVTVYTYTPSLLRGSKCKGVVNWPEAMVAMVKFRRSPEWVHDPNTSTGVSTAESSLASP